MNILVFYFVIVLSHPGTGAAFMNQKDACDYGIIFAATNNWKAIPNWPVKKLTIDISEALFLYEDVDCKKS